MQRITIRSAWHLVLALGLLCGCTNSPTKQGAVAHSTLPAASPNQVTTSNATSGPADFEEQDTLAAALAKRLGCTAESTDPQHLGTRQNYKCLFRGPGGTYDVRILTFPPGDSADEWVQFERRIGESKNYVFVVGDGSSVKVTWAILTDSHAIAEAVSKHVGGHIA